MYIYIFIFYYYFLPTFIHAHLYNISWASLAYIHIFIYYYYFLPTFIHAHLYNISWASLAYTYIFTFFFYYLFTFIHADFVTFPEPAGLTTFPPVFIYCTTISCRTHIVYRPCNEMSEYSHPIIINGSYDVLHWLFLYNIGLNQLNTLYM